MLYLAEVKKQIKSFMGGSETKLKLLACQRNDRSWSVVLGDEVINGEEASGFADGALIVINLGVNRQIQDPPEPAANTVIGFLQNFSRLLEKTKNQEEEIEQWRESLTYQSEELNRRQVEMELRLEQIEQIEQELDRLDRERQEIDRDRQEAETIRKEFEKKLDDLESQKAEILKSKSFNRECMEEISSLVDGLALPDNSFDALTQRVKGVIDSLDSQQKNLNRYWEQLKQQKDELTIEQQKLEREENEFHSLQQEAYGELEAYQQTEVLLQRQEQLLTDKQELTKLLQVYQGEREEIKQSLNRLGIASGAFQLEKPIDIEALEKMSLGELQKIVENLQKDLEKMVRFVNEQEEELTFQAQAVDELNKKLAASSEYERIALETELGEEQERKKMLDEALIGQRRQLRERQEYLLQHCRILRRRQGVFESDLEVPKINLEPIFIQLEQQQQKFAKQQSELNRELDDIKVKIQELQNTYERQKNSWDEKNSNLENAEANLQQSKIMFARLYAKVSFYEENLQPIQNDIDEVRSQIENLEKSILATKELKTSQDKKLSELKDKLTN